MLDRVDEQLEVALPSEENREKILRLYFQRYLVDAAPAAGSVLERLRRMFSGRGTADTVDVSPVDSVRPAERLLATSTYRLPVMSMPVFAEWWRVVVLCRSK